MAGGIACVRDLRPQIAAVLSITLVPANTDTGTISSGVATMLFGGFNMMRWSLRFWLCLAVTVVPSYAKAWCFDEAATLYDLPVSVLEAIAIQESGGNANTVAKNRNKSRDLGLMGINTVHLLASEPLGMAGFTEEVLLEPCMNVKAGAWLLKKQVAKFGLTWWAVGAYHSSTPELNHEYQRKIWAILARRDGPKR